MIESIEKRRFFRLREKLSLRVACQFLINLEQSQVFLFMVLLLLTAMYMAFLLPIEALRLFNV
jgi:hypothetical protein